MVEGNEDWIEAGKWMPGEGGEERTKASLDKLADLVEREDLEWPADDGRGGQGEEDLDVVEMRIPESEYGW